jgi:hypothetical protein
MATIRKDPTFETLAAKVWETPKDFHAADRRVALGFVAKSALELRLIVGTSMV